MSFLLRLCLVLAFPLLSLQFSTDVRGDQPFFFQSPLPSAAYSAYTPVSTTVPPISSFSVPSTGDRFSANTFAQLAQQQQRLQQPQLQAPFQWASGFTSANQQNQLQQISFAAPAAASVVPNFAVSSNGQPSFSSSLATPSFATQQQQRRQPNDVTTSQRAGAPTSPRISRSGIVLRRPRDPNPVVDAPANHNQHLDLRNLTKMSDPGEPVFLLQNVPRNQLPAPSRALPTDPRAVAEWEPVQAAILRFPMGLPLALVRTLSQEITTYVLCTQDLQPQATSTFQLAGVNMANIVFLNIPTDTYWIRDYGPWWISDVEQGRPAVRIVDVKYRDVSTRPNDDRVPQILAWYFNQSTHYAIPIACQGGNFMTDAISDAASTERLMDDNPSMTWEQIRDGFGDVLGLKNYYLLKDPSYPQNYIEHVDCWCKFIGPSKILIKRVPVSSNMYASFEQAATLWTQRSNSQGQRYQVFRVDGTVDAPYVNHVIINDRVFIPVLNTPDDTLALSQIQTAYGPSFRLVPVVADPNLPWLMSDGLHCRLNTIPQFTPL